MMISCFRQAPNDQKVTIADQQNRVIISTNDKGMLMEKRLLV